MTVVSFCRCRIFVLACSLLVCAGFARAAEPEILLLWPEGTPGSEGRSGMGEMRLFGGNERIVSQVHEPSMMVYLPGAANATGAGVVLLPGGGHRELWTDHEGHSIARWLADRGVAAFVVYYRLSKEEGSDYGLREHSLRDAQRALQLVKSRAGDWSLDAERIGVMGFSAGGELAALAGSVFVEGDGDSGDAVNRMGSRPAFQALVYPGSDGGAVITEQSPPAFLLSGFQDAERVSATLTSLLLRFKEHGVAAELHVFADAGHGFGLRSTNEGPSADWLDRFYEWLQGQGFLEGEPGWVSLFNGRNLDGWTVKIAGHGVGDNFKDTFQVADGMIKVSYDDYERFDMQFGHLYTNAEYENYILRMDYKLPGSVLPDAPSWTDKNSGVMLHAQSPLSMTLDQSFPVSLEGQFLAEGTTAGTQTGNVCTPGTHVAIAGERTYAHIVDSTSKLYPGEEWVSFEAEVHGNREIIYRVNGEEVLRYGDPVLDPEDKDARRLLAAGVGESLRRGHIALQAEGHPVWFRNIEIKELKE